MSRANLLKNIVKGSITEDKMLDKYLMSRGINPLHVTKDTKVSHSKSGDFIKWKADHVNESVDKKDTVILDIPLLIRVLELAREDIKTDMDLHRVVEKLISIRNKGVLTMDDYNTIANIKESHIAIAMGKMLDDEGSMVLSQMDQLERAITMIRTHIGKDYEKQLPAWVQSKITLATDYVDTVGNYLSSKNEEVKKETKNKPADIFHRGPAPNEKYVMKQIEKEKKEKLKKEEVVSEVSSELLDRYKTGAKKSADDLTAQGKHKKSTDRWMNIMKATGKQIEKTTASIKKSLNKEETLDEAGYGRNRGYSHGFASPHAPRLGGRREDDEYINGPDKVTHKISFHVSKDGEEKHNRTVTLANSTKSHAEAHAAAKEHLQNQGYKIHEDVYQDPQAATQTVFDGGNNTDDTKSQRSKSARIIKSIYKRQGVKEEVVSEELYDHEKEDKSVKSLGKKNDDREPAAAVLKGGKTMTGTTRDTVEIDPAMRLRPGQPDPTKATPQKR